MSLSLNVHVGVVDNEQSDHRPDFEGHRVHHALNDCLFFLPELESEIILWLFEPVSSLSVSVVSSWFRLLILIEFCGLFVDKVGGSLIFNILLAEPRIC